MVGQHDQVGVEGGYSVGVWLLAVEHVEEVGRVTKTQARRDRLVAVAQALPGSDEAGHDRRQVQRLVARAGIGDVVGVAVEQGQGADGRAQDGHRLGVAGEAAHDVQQRFRHGALGL